MNFKCHLFKQIFASYRYHSLAPMYYRGAQAAIVVYDIQNQDSFQRAKTWVKELHKQVSVIIAGHLHSSVSGIAIKVNAISCRTLRY